MTPPRPTETDSRLGVLLLSGCGLGLSPIMPGTVASLATAVVVWMAGETSQGSYWSCAVLLVLAGWVATLRFAGAVTGPKNEGDPGWVVSDEVAGQALALLVASPPFAQRWLDLGSPDFQVVVAAFLLFRVFDMLKPPPVSTLEKLHGARGILYDDIAAGLLAGVIVLILRLTHVVPL